MRPITTVSVAVAAAAATAFAVHALAPQPDRAPALDRTTELRAELDALRDRVAGLAQELERRSGAAAPASLQRTPVPMLDDAQIAAALDRYLATHGAALPGDAAAAAAEPAAAPTVDEAFAELTGSSNLWDGNQDRYRQLFEAGLLDELVERFQQRARAEPNNPGAQVDLANAYLAALQMEPGKYQYSILADRAFDEALDIDPNHWEARFMKAVSLSFWPDALGRKKDAIAQFELLAEQQSLLPAEQHHVQTYLYLGNLLEQRGETERARQVWQQGLQRHPNAAELRQKLGQ